MAEGNIETVRRIFDGWAKGDFSVGADALDPHVTVVVRPPFIEFGVFHGPEGIREWFLVFLEQFERMTMEATDLRAVGDTVVVEVLQRGEGKASGIDMELSFFMLFTFRGAMIVRIETVMAEAEALEAVGLPG
jgi:ketosteroid isomerase-like protein